MEPNKKHVRVPRALGYMKLYLYFSMISIVRFFVMENRAVAQPSE